MISFKKNSRIVEKDLKNCFRWDIIDPVDAFVCYNDFQLHRCNFAIFTFSHFEKYVFKV